MKSEFLIKRQKDVDKLADIVLCCLDKDLKFKIIPRGGGRSKTRPLDYSISDLESAGEKYGRFEYRLLENGLYEVIFEMDIPEVYDKVINRITKFYPRLVPAEGKF